MIKVLIVEDEFLIRVGIQSTIEWQENGFDIIGAVANGEEALAFCDQNYPDIIISDLEMPSLNGMELMRVLKAKGFNAKFLILTCHTDFDYMQEALRLGASDYIVKATMEPEDLLEAMLKLKSEIIAERENTKLFTKLQEDYSKIQIEREKERLKNFLLAISSETDSYDKIFFESLNIAADTLCDLILFRIDHFYNLSAQTSSERKILQRSVIQIVEASISEKAFSFFYDQANILCVFPEFISQKQKEQVLSDIYERVNAICGITLSTILIQKRIEIKNAPQTIKMMQNKMKEKVLFPISFVHILQFQPDSRALGDQVLVREFLSQILMNHLLDSKSYIEKFIVSLRNYRNGIMLLDILLQKLQLIWDRCKLEGDLMDRKEIFQHYDSSDTLQQWVEGIVNRLPYIYVSEHTIENESIKLAVEYLEDHFLDNCTLIDVANYVHMSPSYFSHLFKQETGYSFVTYLNELKITRAKLLLTTTDFKLSSIAQLSGFDDNSYFIRTFKKYVGTTPTIFREKS